MREILVGLVMWLGLQSGLTVPGGIARISGVDAGSGIAYVLISADGRVVGTDTAAGGPVPRLTAQCTKMPDGKLRFEMLADFGKVDSVAYIAPFKASKEQPFAPPVASQAVTMEFLGYTKVKPVKRQWFALAQIPGEWKYATPGMSSGNMEEVTFYLQYMRSLPTLRLTLPGKASAEWETMKWQAAVKAEPLCGASGL